MNKSDRTHLRFRGEVCETIKFEQKNALLPINIKVLNISTGGLAASIEEKDKFKRGDVLGGELIFAKHRHTVELEVRHVTKHVVGCRFRLINANAIADLEEFLSTELAGAGLRMIRKDLLKHEENGEPVWLTDSNKNEVFYVLKLGKVVKFHLTFMGHHVFWAAGQPLKLGIVKRDEHKGPQIYKPSDMILVKEELTESLINLATRFLEAVPEFDYEVLQQIREILVINKGAS